MTFENILVVTKIKEPQNHAELHFFPNFLLTLFKNPTVCVRDTTVGTERAANRRGREAEKETETRGGRKF